MANQPDLTPLELHAIDRVAKGASKVRDHLEEGTSADVDLTVRFTGTLSVGLGDVKQRSVKPDLVGLLGLVLEVLSTGTRRNLELRLNQMYANFAGSEHSPQPEQEMRILAETLIARWSKQEEYTQRGSVTGTIAAEVVERG